MPQWKFPYDAYGVPSLDLRIQAMGGSYVDLSGTVDSGASSTVLSREHAAQLGLNPSDLQEAEKEAIIADGSKVPCWTAVVPIRGKVLRTSPGGDLIPWGPVFKVTVVFLEHADPLWGQADFFATFAVTFWRNTAPYAFGLTH